MSQWFSDNQCAALHVLAPCLLPFLGKPSPHAKLPFSHSGAVQGALGQGPTAHSSVTEVGDWTEAPCSYPSLAQPSVLGQVDVEMKHPDKRGKWYLVPVAAALSRQS